MARTWQIGWMVLLVSVGGCGTNSSSEPVGPEFPSDPAAQAAYEFLDAVLKGDSQRASRHLSPQAMQQIVESGKQFAPPGLESAKFRVGEIRQPTSSQSLVQCFLTDNTTADGQAPREEEICCLMRLVDDQWRVSGIAYSVGPDQRPMILDFENPPGDSPANRPVAAAGNSGANPQAGRPSPPRTAQDPAYASPSSTR
jgi:hypothetical protein